MGVGGTEVHSKNEFLGAGVVRFPLRDNHTAETAQVVLHARLDVVKRSIDIIVASTVARVGTDGVPHGQTVGLDAVLVETQCGTAVLNHGEQFDGVVVVDVGLDKGEYGCGHRCADNTARIAALVKCPGVVVDGEVLARQLDISVLAFLHADTQGDHYTAVGILLDVQHVTSGNGSLDVVGVKVGKQQRF